MKTMIVSLISVSRPVLGFSLMFAAMASFAQAGLPQPAPEIDPGSIGSALALLASGALVLSGKTRKA